MNITTKHAAFRMNRNGAMRFVCADILGARFQFSAVRCRKSATRGIERGAIRTLAIFVGLVGSSLASVSVFASII